MNKSFEVVSIDDPLDSWARENPRVVLAFRDPATTHCCDGACNDEASLRIQPPLIRSYVVAGANERRLYSQAMMKLVSICPQLILSR